MRPFSRDLEEDTWRSERLIHLIRFRGFSGDYKEGDRIRITGELEKPEFVDAGGVIVEKREWYPGWLVIIEDGAFKGKFVLVKEKNIILKSRTEAHPQRWSRKRASLPPCMPLQVPAARVETRVVVREANEASAAREVSFPTSASFYSLGIDGVQVTSDAFFENAGATALSNDLLDELGLELVVDGNGHRFAQKDAAKRSRGFLRESSEAIIANDLPAANAKLSAAIQTWDGYSPVQLYANRSELCRLLAQNSKDSEDFDHWICQALVNADEAITRRPEWSRGYSRRGNVLAMLDRLNEAIAAYDEALRINPENSHVSQAREKMLGRLSDRTAF